MHAANYLSAGCVIKSVLPVGRMEWDGVLSKLLNEGSTRSHPWQPTSLNGVTSVRHQHDTLARHAMMLLLKERERERERERISLVHSASIGL